VNEEHRTDHNVIIKPVGDGYVEVRCQDCDWTARYPAVDIEEPLPEPPRIAIVVAWMVGALLVLLAVITVVAQVAIKMGWAK
jgi:hypothetical protein